MEEGSFRCDANVSLRPVGSDGARRQGGGQEHEHLPRRRAGAGLRDRPPGGGARAPEAVSPRRPAAGSRSAGVTVSQRSKEQAHDYRYFPEPDLPPLFLTADRVDAIRARLPELPAPKRRRFAEQYGLSPQDAFTLTATRDLASFYEATVKEGAGARPTANWILRDVLRLVNAAGGSSNPGASARPTSRR